MSISSDTWRDSDALDTLSRGSRLIDADCGVIRLLYEHTPDPDLPQIFGFGSILADTSKYGVENFGLVNGSTSIVRESAAAGAFGEAVERYASRIVPYGDIVWRSIRRIDARALDPRSLVLYSETQYQKPDFPYRRVNVDESIPWIRGYSLTNGGICMVPAEFVFMSSLGEGRPLVQQTTNGLACGSSLESATLSALYEVVERDALMRAWLGRRPGHSLDPREATNPSLIACLERFAQVSWPLTIVDITTDIGIPCVLARTELGPKFGRPPIFSSSADGSRERAAQAALEELAQCLPWVTALIDRRVAPKSPNQLSTTEDHVLWLAGPDQRHHADFLTPESNDFCPWGREINNTSPAAALASAVAKLAHCGLEAIVVEITPPDVAEAGIHVVRVLIPGALPLYFGSGLWRVSSDDACVLSPRAVDKDGLSFNRLPHPFP